MLALSALLLAGLGVVGVRPAAAHTPHDEIVGVDVSPDFDDDGTVYTISRAYLLKSTDRGDTWTRLVNGLDNRGSLSSLDVAATDADVLYVSTRGDGVYRSDDGGDSWNRANGDMGPQFLEFVTVSPHDPDVAVVGAARPEGGAWLTEDGGTTWTALGDYVSIAEVGFAWDDPDVLVLAEKSGAVHVSDDLGSTWTTTDLELEGDNEIQTVLVDSSYQQTQRFYVGTTSDGIRVTEDGGMSFTNDTQGLSDPKIIDLMQTGVDTDQPVLWASTSDEGVFISDDGGASWRPETDGLTTDEMADRIGHPNFGDLSAVRDSAEAEPTVFSGSFDGLFRSDSRAAGWVNLATQLSTNVVGLAVSPDYANDATVAVATYINGALLSRDGAQTWQPISDGLAAEFEWKRREDYVVRLTGIQMYPTFPEDGMMQAGVRGYYIESSNSGEDWSHRLPEGIIVPDEFPPDYYVPAFSPDFEQDRTILLGTDGGKVFRYTGDADAIELIANIETEITAMAISPGFTEDQTVLAGTADGVSYSTDAGVTWSSVQLGGLAAPPATSLALSPDFATDGTAFVGTPIGLRVSTDSGASWQDASDPVFGALPTIEAVAISPPVDGETTMLVSVRGRGLFLSTDGGESFAEVAPDLLENQVVFNSFYHPTSEPIVFSPTFAEDQTVFAMAEDHIFKSTDAGETWATIDIPVTLHDVNVPPDEDFLPSTKQNVAAVSGGDVVSEGDAFDTPIGRLSPKRVGASVLAGLVMFGLLSLPLRRREDQADGDATGAADADGDGETSTGDKTGALSRMALLPNPALRAVAGVGVMVVALFALAA